MSGTMSLSLHVSISARRANAEGWGDFPFALRLIEAFQRLGHNASLFYRDETPELTGQRDVVIRIVGPHLEDPVPEVPNLLWMISRPNVCTGAALSRYQKVFFASAPLASAYASLGLNAGPLLQCTDGGLFNPQTNDGLAPSHDVVFVGNRAGRAPRTNVLAAVRLGFNVKIWGRGWEGKVPAENLVGTRVDTAELARIYAGSRIVLNSHMPDMAQLGFMSNRSYDALACGASVVSDRVQQFSCEGLDGLHMAAPDDASLADTLTRILAADETPAMRMARSDAVLADSSFDVRARLLAAEADLLLSQERRAGQLLRFLPQVPPTGAHRSSHLRDLPDEAEATKFLPDAGLSRLCASHSLDVTLTLSDPSVSPPDMSPAEAHRRSAAAVLRICSLLALEDGLAALKIIAEPAEARTGVIHGGMTDHRAARSIAMMDPARRRLPETRARITDLWQRSRRVLDFRMDETHPLAPRSNSGDLAKVQIRLMNNRPLFAHSPAELERDRHKRHLQLWSRSNPDSPQSPVGVFLHLFYPELTPVFRDRLEVLEAPHRVYISTDTDAKANEISRSFPAADIRVLPNRGRDVFPKLYGFPGAYRDHDLVLHLHGKKSLHARVLDQWLEHCLDGLLPKREETARILSLFQSIPSLGMAMPLVFPSVIGAAHWSDNREIAEELAHRMGLTDPLPDDANIDFPVGSMFWARTRALRPLLELDLQASHCPPEYGQVDATVAHAIERLYGVVCRATGHRMLRVAPSGNHMYKSHRFTARSNREVRTALESGFFGD